MFTLNMYGTRSLYMYILGNIGNEGGQAGKKWWALIRRGWDGAADASIVPKETHLGCRLGRESKIIKESV